MGGWPAQAAGRVDTTRSGLEGFARSLQKSDEVVIEATGNAMVVSHLLTPRVARVVIANPIQVKAIAHAHVKTDKIDAGVLANLYAAGYLPEVWTPDEGTERFADWSPDAIRLSVTARASRTRRTASRSQKLDYALLSSLQRDPLLKERLRRLRTVPGVGPITALTWALEIGDFTRFSSIKQAISYCGLCGDEKSSADKVMPMPISKQRNKHIQRVLIEAAKLAPRESPELAVIRARELERGNPNRATLAVARKMVSYMLAVERRKQDFVPAEEFGRTAAA